MPATKTIDAHAVTAGADEGRHGWMLAAVPLVLVVQACQGTADLRNTDSFATAYAGVHMSKRPRCWERDRP